MLTPKAARFELVAWVAAIGDGHTHSFPCCSFRKRVSARDRLAASFRSDSNGSMTAFTSTARRGALRTCLVSG